MYIKLFGNSNPTYIMLYPMPKASSMIYDDRYPRVCTAWILRFQSNDRFWKIVHDDLPVVVIPDTIIRVTHDQFQEGIEMKYITSIGKYCNCNVHTTNRWGKKKWEKDVTEEARSSVFSSFASPKSPVRLSWVKNNTEDYRSPTIFHYFCILTQSDFVVFCKEYVWALE